MLPGRTIAIPERDMWDDTTFRVVAVAPGGATDKLIKRLRRDASPVHMVAAVQKVGALLGATHTTMKVDFNPFRMTVLADFPDVAAWETAMHIDKHEGVSGVPAPPEYYYRGVWVPTSEWNSEPNVPGRWRLGGLGRSRHVSQSADWRLFRAVAARKDWQARLNGHYKYALWQAQPTFDSPYAVQCNDDAVEVVRIAGQKQTLLKLPLRADSRDRWHLFVPEGCTPVRRQDLYAGCDKF